MPLPDALTTTTLSGTYTAPDGTPLGGQLTFTPSSALTNESGHPVLAATPLTVRLAPGTGSFSISLLNTDNALLPDTWMWHVIVAVPGAQESYFFGLPSTLGPATDINTLTPVSPPPSGASFVSSINGQTGDVILADGFGILPPAGDLGGGTTLAPQVTATHLSAPLPVVQGGTGAASGSAALSALGAASASALAAEVSRAEAAEAGFVSSAALATETSRAETAEALLAPKASPALTGSPTAPTQTTGDATTKIATDAFVGTAVAAEATRATAAEALKQGVRTPTAVKTGTSYSAVAGDFAKIDSTAGAYTVTLPAAPADKTVIGVKLVASAATVNAVTITRGGSDTFNLPGGATTLTLKVLNQGVQLQYNASAGVWDVHGDDLPLGGLDSRYLTGPGEFSVLAYGADPTGSADSTTAIQAAQAAALAAGGGYVVFGPGTFKLGTITVAGVTSGSSYLRPPLVHFRFAGPGVTILTPLSANQPLFQVQSGKFSAGVRFEGGFTVKAHASGSTGPAIDLTSARQWVIESPSYLDSLSGGVGTPGTYAQVIGFGVNTYGCRIVNPVCEAQTLGACFAGSINNTTVVANSNTIENPLFEGCTAPHMIDAAGTIMLTISDGIIEGNNTTSAIRLGWMTTVRNCYFEQGSATGISFSMSAAGADNPTLGYDPGQCWLENNIHASNPDTLVIPSGVHPYTTLIWTPAFGSAFTITDNTSTLIEIGSGAIVLPPTTTLLNNASGGTNGTTVTTGNSGAGSGNAFSGVTTGSGLTFDNTEAVAPSALSYKLVASATLPSLKWNVPATMSQAAAMYMRGYVYFSGSAFNCSVLTSAGLWYALSVVSGNWSLRAFPGTTVTGPAVSGNTWYRAELVFTPGNGTCTARIYNLTGTLLSTLSATGGSQTTIASAEYGLLSSGTGTMWLAALGLSNAGWLGPVFPTDQAAADIQPLGTQAAGALGVPADAGHVHQMPTLDQVAAPVASVGLASQKITGLANGSASTDAAAFGQIASALNYAGIFGDGSDGAATLDGTATVAWASKSGSVYTMTRDCYLTSLTISSGVTLSLYTAGAFSDYLIFCTGTVTNNGTISANGASASGTNNSAGGVASSGGSIGATGAGGAGNTGAGAAGTLVSPAVGVGEGGSGGAGSGGAGGTTAGGNGTSVSIFRRPQSVVAGFGFLSGLFRIAGGGGGAGGGGDGTNKGGGGGAGAGVIAILARAVINNGTISAVGGNGGTPTTGNCGGGGPGGGGSIFAYTLSAWTAGTTAVTGGTAGAGVGTGVAGTPNASNPNGQVLNVALQ